MKSNEDLQKDVLDSLTWEPRLHAAEIGVTVKEGVVTLTGIVECYEKKAVAEKTAKNVAGVKAVIANVKVKINTWTDPSDADILKEIENAFKWQYDIPEDKVSIKAENGWVTLTGTVTWNYQKEAACNAVSRLVGVKGITSLIKIMPLQQKVNKKDIEAALLRSANINKEKIRVEVAGNRATLTGEVTSWCQMQEAENIAWCSPGIQQVDNQLVIVVQMPVVQAIP